MGSFTKDLTVKSPLAGSDEFVLSDGTSIITQKTTLSSISAYIGSNPITPPLILTDPSAFTASVGTIYWNGQTGAATLSSGTDYTNLSVDDVIIIGTTISNIVVSKDGGVNITVRRTFDLPSAVSFFYGSATLITRDNLSNPTNFFSKGGIHTNGPVLVDGAVTMNEMVKKKRQPSFCAYLTSSQNIVNNLWTRVNFNIVNRTDTPQVTHTIVPTGKTSFDTTNCAFVVPYGDGYDAEVYSISVSVWYYSLYYVGSLRGYFYVKVMGVSTPTSTTGVDLLWVTEEFKYLQKPTPTEYDSTLNVSGQVLLSPRTVPNHRYLKVYVLYNVDNLGIPQLTRVQPRDGATFFSGTCLG
jgi:hypothetical protein